MTSPRRTPVRVSLLTALFLIGGVTVAGAPGAASRPARLLPNLRPIVPLTFYSPETNVDVNYAFGGGVIVDGCTADETARKLARRCLRFDTVLVNRGRGPFEIAYRLDAEHNVLAAHQRIYRTDGTRTNRYAADTEYHPTHLHFHIKDIYVARLWRARPNGDVRGSRPTAQSDKNGFCPEDSRAVSTMPGERRYQCFSTNAEPASGVAQVVGISSGWADVYPYTLPDQFIEITSVKDGLYLFELEIDPHNYFVESAEADNAKCVLIRLDGNNASPMRRETCPS